MLCLELVPPVYTAPIAATTTGASFTTAGGAGLGGVAGGATVGSAGGVVGHTSTTTSTSVHTNASGVDVMGGPTPTPATTATLPLPGGTVGGADDVAAGMARYRERSNDWISAQV